MSGYVYIITYDNAEWRKVIPYIKVGMAQDIERRIKALSTGSPVSFTLAGYIKTDSPDIKEKELHDALGMLGARIKQEWFKINERSMSYFDNLQEIEENHLHALFPVIDPEIVRNAFLRECVTNQNKRIVELENQNKIMRDRLIEIDPMAHKFIEKVSIRPGNYATYKLLKPRR